MASIWAIISHPVFETSRSLRFPFESRSSDWRVARVSSKSGKQMERVSGEVPRRSVCTVPLSMCDCCRKVGRHTAWETPTHVEAKFAAQFQSGRLRFFHLSAAFHSGGVFVGNSTKNDENDDDDDQGASGGDGDLCCWQGRSLCSGGGQGGEDFQGACGHLFNATSW